MKIWNNNPRIRDFSVKTGISTPINTSLTRATSILNCVSNGINTNIEIAKYCHYSTSTAHRLLQTLKGLNWVVQDKISRRYYLGPQVTQLSTNPLTSHRHLIIQSLQEMERLSALTSETINLTILAQFRYVLLHDIPCKQELKITEHLQVTGILFAVGATGKVLLSQLPDEEIREVLNKFTLAQITDRSVTDKRLLLAQLNEIRQKDYAISCGEKLPGAVCVSAPVKNYLFPAALSILGPEVRLTNTQDIVKELKLGASRISENIARVFAEGGETKKVTILR